MRAVFVLFFAIVVCSACDDTFSPIQPSDVQFSIFGFLDASADTQWVRVMPLRPVLTTEPGPLGAVVSIENVATGQVVELRDSVFRFGTNPDVGSEGVYLHNYWTTEVIEPGVTYRFSAITEGHEESSAVIEIPPDYSVEVWLAQERSQQDDLVRITGLEHLGLVLVIIHLRDACGPDVQRNLFDTRAPSTDGIMVPISARPRGTRENCGSPQISSREILIVGSGEEWPSGFDNSPSALGVADAPSNVSNAVGFLGGVLTKLLPYETCRIDSREPTGEHCKLRYDALSATLLGTVVSSCGNSPVADASVELRELDPDRPAAPKVRPTRTDHSGRFDIHALEAERRYAISVWRLSSEGADEFLEYTDTLQFAPGEDAAYEAALHPRGSC